MRFRQESLATQFDISDVSNIDGSAATVDSLDDVLGVAASVLEEYGLDSGNTRIEKMARWLWSNVGHNENPIAHGNVVQYKHDDVDVVVWCVNNRITIAVGQECSCDISPECARGIA